MKARPLKFDGETYVPCSPCKATHISMRFPGPFWYRLIPVIKGKREGTPCWSWNGDTEFPTLRPSILTYDGRMKCHSFLTDGKVKFLADSTHELAGTTVDLLDVDD